MNKIPTVYKRNPDNMKYVTDEVNPGCEWVLNDEGIPTRKWDGTCVLFVEERSPMAQVADWWARREVKKGKTPPPNFVKISEDKNTGNVMGWEPIKQSGFYKFFEEAITNAMYDQVELYPHTYELIGPKINNGLDKFGMHLLIPHGKHPFFPMRRSDNKLPTPAQMMMEVKKMGWEGLVWHHPDGRMAKLKVRDYA